MLSQTTAIKDLC